nr:zinc finger, CCHC-type [Tanacetum cinerariifolium]
MAAAAMKHMASNISKLDKFERVDFRRWQKKIHFFLSSMSVVYVVTTLIPEDGGDDETNFESFKELWDSLEAKYMAGDASSKKFLVSNFKNYKMSDSRPVLEQYNELLDFKHTLKHKREELTLVELRSHLCIEEPLRVQDSDKPKSNNVLAPLDDDVAWWVDSRANVHVCKDRCWFKTYESLNDGSILHMGNKSIALVRGRGYVNLRGGEYMDTLYFQSVGIIHETTAPYTSQQISERKNRVLKEMVNFMLSYSGLSQGLWGEAMLTACYLLNRVHNKRNKITPYELWTKRKPNLDYLTVWSCRAVVRLPDPTLKTLGERGIECMFAGYAEHSKAFRDVFSDQHSYYFNVEDDPKTLDETIKSRDVAFWKESINDEMGSIIGNNIWGFKQKSGICYFDTYAPVARISTIRLLIAIASIHNMIIHQMDVKTTFLIGELEEEVYMNQPQGFIMPSNENKVDLIKEFLSSTLSMKDIGEANVILATQRVLKYLKKTMDYRLTHTGYPLVLEGYTNASWINNNEDNLSTSGWIFLLGGGEISWASKKQTCITGSTMESEFVASAAAGKEAEWLKKMLIEISLWVKPIAPISIRYDSAITLAKAYSQMYNRKSRHLGVRHSMIRELIMNGVVSIEFVRSQQNLANHLTKGLTRDMVIKFVEGMSGLKHMYLHIIPRMCLEPVDKGR